MYSVVEIAGHQYKVKPGDQIDVNKLQSDEKKEIQFDKVLFVGGEAPTVGLPLVTGAVVKAKVLFHDKSKKILTMKRRPGSYRKKIGHRQQFTSLLITEITDGKGKSISIDKESKLAKKYL